MMISCQDCTFSSQVSFKVTDFAEIETESGRTVLQPSYSNLENIIKGTFNHFPNSDTLKFPLTSLLKLPVS